MKLDLSSCILDTCAKIVSRSRVDQSELTEAKFVHPVVNPIKLTLEMSLYTINTHRNNTIEYNTHIQSITIHIITITIVIVLVCFENE